MQEKPKNWKNLSIEQLLEKKITRKGIQDVRLESIS